MKVRERYVSYYQWFGVMLLYVLNWGWITHFMLYWLQRGKMNG